jgi:hypothetical protein
MAGALASKSGSWLLRLLPSLIAVAFQGEGGIQETAASQT